MDYSLGGNPKSALLVSGNKVHKVCEHLHTRFPARKFRNEKHPKHWEISVPCVLVGWIFLAFRLLNYTDTSALYHRWDSRLSSHRQETCNYGMVSADDQSSGIGNPDRNRHGILHLCNERHDYRAGLAGPDHCPAKCGHSHVPVALRRVSPYSFRYSGRYFLPVRYFALCFNGERGEFIPGACT